jgi:hypothetical protein
MTKTELQSLLIKEDVPENYYSLEGGMPDEKLCLERTPSGWAVYYSERGLRTSLKYFTSEDQACRYFYTEISDAKRYW